MIGLKGMDVSSFCLRNIDLCSVAEDDASLRNRDVFIKTDSYCKMLSDWGVLVIGRKGSGKTAIRLGLKEFGDIQHDMWVELGLRRLDFCRFRNLLVNILPEYPDGLELLLQNTWRVTIVCAMMAKAKHGGLINSRDSKLTPMIDSYFKKYGITDEDEFFQFVPDQVLSRICAAASMPRDIGRQNMFPLDEEFLKIEKHLMGALNAGLGAVVTVDNLDDCVVKKYYHETVVPTTEALVKTAKELVSRYGKANNQVINPEQQKLRIKCFVPQDMFSSSEYRHTDKLADNATTIYWTSGLLREMLARRIAPHLGGAFKHEPDKYAAKIIQLVFGQRVLGYWGLDEPFHLLICYTLLRPRDVLFFTNEIFKRVCVSDEDATEVPEDMFFHYLRRVTEDYSSNIIREYQSKWPQLKEAVELLRNERALLPIERLKEKWCQNRKGFGEKDWQDTVQSLFDAGVIGYETFAKRVDFGNIDKRIRFSFVCKKEEKAPLKGNIAIHPLFWSAYAIIPEKFKIEIP